MILFGTSIPASTLDVNFVLLNDGYAVMFKAVMGINGRLCHTGDCMELIHSNEVHLKK